MRAYGGCWDRHESLPHPISVARLERPRVIPNSQRRLIRRHDARADRIVKMYLSMFSVSKLVLVPKQSNYQFSSIVDDPSRRQTSRVFWRSTASQWRTFFLRYVPELPSIGLIFGSCLQSLYGIARFSRGWTPRIRIGRRNGLGRLKVGSLTGALSLYCLCSANSFCLRPSILARSQVMRSGLRVSSPGNSLFSCLDRGLVNGIFKFAWKSYFRWYASLSSLLGCESGAKKKLGYLPCLESFPGYWVCDFIVSICFHLEMLFHDCMYKSSRA